MLVYIEDKNFDALAEEKPGRMLVLSKWLMKQRKSM